jgi:putative phage-type endonuclease
MHEGVKKLLEREYAEQRSEEWLALRQNMLTASDAATAIGENKYETPNGLLLKKCGYNKFMGNAATEHGNKYEDEARVLYEQRYGEIVHEIGLCPHPKYSWLGGSPDGVSESGKLIEIKCPMSRVITPEVPPHYMPQLQLCMEILDLEECDFIQYKAADFNWPKPEELVVTRVPRDRGWFEKYLPVMETFWQKVLHHREHGIEPPKPKKTRVPKEVPPQVCEITSDSEDNLSYV